MWSVLGILNNVILQFLSQVLVKSVKIKLWSFNAIYHFCGLMEENLMFSVRT